MEKDRLAEKIRENEEKKKEEKIKTVAEKLLEKSAKGDLAAR